MFPLLPSHWLILEIHNGIKVYLYLKYVLFMYPPPPPPPPAPGGKKKLICERDTLQ